MKLTQSSVTICLVSVGKDDSINLCKKLALHFQKPQVFLRVPFVPAIVLQFLIGFRNSSVDLGKNIIR